MLQLRSEEESQEHREVSPARQPVYRHSTKDSIEALWASIKMGPDRLLRKEASSPESMPKHLKVPAAPEWFRNSEAGLDCQNEPRCLRTIASEDPKLLLDPVRWPLIQANVRADWDSHGTKKRR